MIKQKLDCILLIDDNSANNYLHKRIIDKSGIAKKVVAIDMAHKALDYLKSVENSRFSGPDIIFLDINMPLMNGWEFIEEYKKIYGNQKKEIITFMITTSLNPDDEKRAMNIPLIQGFRKKPLSLDILQDIVEKHFADRL